MGLLTTGLLGSDLDTIGLILVLIVSGDNLDDKVFMNSSFGVELDLGVSDFPENLAPLKSETFSIWSNLEKMFFDWLDVLDVSDFKDWLEDLDWSDFPDKLKGLDWSDLLDWTVDLDWSILLDWLKDLDCSDFPERFAARLANPLNGFAPGLLDCSLLVDTW